MNGYHLLLVDDDLRLRGLVKAHLETEGFAIETLSNGEQIEHILQVKPVDLLILDIGLPQEDGLSICRRLRPHWDLPILMLTARGDELDRIIGLEMGADDYLAKPFHPRELIARIRAILRRSSRNGHRQITSPSQLKLGPFDVSAEREEISFRQSRLPLTHADFLLLYTLMRRSGEPVSREQILWITRRRSLEADDRSVDMQISRLRKILGNEGSEIIRTVRGRGYQFFAPET